MIRQITLAAVDRASYAERVRVQTLRWAEGYPYHNAVDDECCPDFSCCRPQMFESDAGERWKHYHDKHGRRN